MDFFTVTSCRVIDTREPIGPLGGPALAAGADRQFTVAGSCSIPPSAQAISVNITVISPTTVGNLRLHAGGTAIPTASTINFAAGQTRANNAVVMLAAPGTLAVYCGQSSGTTEMALDVNGYFMETGSVCLPSGAPCGASAQCCSGVCAGTCG